MSHSYWGWAVVCGSHLTCRLIKASMSSSTSSWGAPSSGSWNLEGLLSSSCQISKYSPLPGWNNSGHPRRRLYLAVSMFEQGAEEKLPSWGGRWGVYLSRGRLSRNVPWTHSALDQAAMHARLPYDIFSRTAGIALHAGNWNQFAWCLVSRHLGGGRVVEASLTRKWHRQDFHEIAQCDRIASVTLSPV